MNKIPVSVLAATGSVGQRFIQLLDGHPWFEVVAVTGSERGYGKTYAEVCRWILPGDMPAWARNLPVLPTSPEAVQASIAFSGLPADIAREVEPLFAHTGIAVCSNASAYRREPDVPILLPEVNPEHARVIELQRQKRGWSGLIATNPNCTSTGMTVALKALQNAFGLRKVFAVSLQALSGAGYPGSLPWISWTMSSRTSAVRKKKWNGSRARCSATWWTAQIQLAEMGISAHTNRVAVTDGHIVCLTVEFEQRATPERGQ